MILKCDVKGAALGSHVVHIDYQLKLNQPMYLLSSVPFKIEAVSKKYFKFIEFFMDIGNKPRNYA